MNYSEKLKHPKWQRKRLEVLQRDNFKCCLCNDDETELHVHHLKYTKEPYDAPLEDLQTLCKLCHNVVESNKEYKILECIKYENSEDKNSVFKCYLYRISKEYAIMSLYENNEYIHELFIEKNSLVFKKLKEWFYE